MYTEVNWKAFITLWWSLLSISSDFLANGDNSPPCGGTLTATRGILQTPGFPNEFQVPILCKWVIDATEIASTNTSIVVYLTQLFVFEGLSFEEYETYDRRYNILGKRIHTVFENNVSKVKWVRTQQNVLVVTFQLQSIENTHLRILDYFLDVYGFNITYEITSEPIRSNSCTMSDCGFTGICYDDFTQFYCQCFVGYSGPTCSDGSNSLCSIDGSPFCENSGSCRHIGTTFVKCDCYDGYNGEQCQSSSTKHECNDRSSGHSCNCPKETSTNADGTELSTTLRLMQGPSLRKEHLQQLLQNQISGSKLGLSQIERVKVSHLNYYEWGTEATVHFYGLKKDKKRIEALINKWIHGGHIGNLTLIDRNISLKNDTRLFIKSISINQMGLIREGEQFILSCVAQGTPTTTFRWIKDGMPINVSQFLSNKWFRLIQDPQIKNQYTALLGVDKASFLDEGTFVCEAEDFGVRQCLSRVVEIRRPPNVKIEPMSLTVQKGENFTIKCICLSHKNYDYKFTYSWTKNKELLPIKTDMEKYEILFPGGSILQVSKIDKPATYSCLVQNEITSTEVSIQVDVIDRNMVHTCRGEKHMNILWPETAPGTQSIQECPRAFTGVVRRWCVLHDSEQSVWQLPDFSLCAADPLVKVNDNFQRLHLGYEQGNGLQMLQSYRTYLKARAVLLPGEGAQILALVNNIVSYINSSNDFTLIYNVTNTIFDIVDNIMKHSNSLINQVQVTLLQQIVKNQVYFAEEIMKTVPAYHQTFSSVDVSIGTAYKPNSFPRVPFPKQKYPSWFGYKLEVNPSNQPDVTSSNESLILSCVVYKNLSAFLPTRSAIRMIDGVEMEYEIISKIVAVWLFKHDKLITDVNRFSFVMEFSHSTINTSMNKWSINCSVAPYASYGYNWDITGCYTEVVNSSLTKCTCTYPGSYAVLITSMPLADIRNVTWTIMDKSCTLCEVSGFRGICPMNSSLWAVSETSASIKSTPTGSKPVEMTSLYVMSFLFAIIINRKITFFASSENYLLIAKEEYHSYQTLVLMGCCFCLFFSTVSEIVLIVYWIVQKSSIVFLKVQYCLVLASAMGIFVIALSNELANECYAYINTMLEIFLLTALSSHISKCLIVFTETVQLSNAPNLNKTVVAISTGVPVITVFASHLTHRTMGKRQPSWWLINGSVSFNIFITAFLIMIFLYNVMYLMVMEKLTQSNDNQIKNPSLVLERKKLLRRSFCIFWATVMMICSSVMYINMRESQIWNYTFVLSNILLVTILFTCYILKPETPMVEQLIERFKITPTNKCPGSTTDRSPSNSKNEADFEKQPAANKTEPNCRSIGHSKSATLNLSDLQNIPTYARNNSVETRSIGNTTTFANPDSATSYQCGNFQDIKSCMNTQRHHKECTKHKQDYHKPDLQEYMYSPDVVATRVHVELDLVTPLIHDANCDHTNLAPDDKPIILCNIAVNSRCERNQKAFPPYSDSKDDKSSSENLENVSKVHLKCERFQPEGVDNDHSKEVAENLSTQTVSQKSGDSMDGMLDKISHDLDYLLNRKKSESNANEETDKEPDDSYQKTLHTHTF